MGLLGGLFNDVVDIAAAPIKIVTKVADEVMEADFVESVDAIKDCIKTDRDN